MTDATTIPVPGFTQKNSVGETIEAENDQFQSSLATPMKEESSTEDDATPDNDVTNND